VNAILFSQWAVRIPDVKAALGISDAQLGFALLASPLGVVTATPLITFLIHKYGSARMSISGTILMSLAIICLALPNSLIGLTISLFLFGVSNGLYDISMNSLASAVEKSKQKVIMSTTHGFWSLAAMVSSLLAGYITSMSIPYSTHFIISALICVAIVIPGSKSILTIRDIGEEAYKWKWPGTTIVGFIIMAFIIFFVEGGIMDWNSMFYQDVLDSPAGMLGFGFAAFSLAMAIARFSGDVLLENYNSYSILLGGCVILSAGLGLYSIGYSIFLCSFAMILSGLGCSILIPTLFREAGMQPNIAPSMGIGLVSTLGYTGFLAGPPILGFISESYSLRASFAFLAVFVLFGGLVSLILWSVSRSH